MAYVINFLYQYWYMGVVVIILAWEIVRLIIKFILKKVLGTLLAPLKIVIKTLFSNQKVVNIELLVCLATAIAIIAYLIVFRLG